MSLHDSTGELDVVVVVPLATGAASARTKWEKAKRRNMSVTAEERVIDFTFKYPSNGH
jgi:hypothetical protein